MVTKPPSETQAESPNAEAVLESLTGAEFADWYREYRYRRNIQDGTPFFNGVSPIPDPDRHRPSSLLQCHRKVAYRQANAPEEESDPTGIFWFGEKFEEELALPFLQEVVTDDSLYVSNNLWIDYRVDTDAGSLHIKGETDPVIVDEESKPVLPTEIKTTSSLDHKDSPSPHHKAQLYAYLYGLSRQYNTTLTDGALLYASRDELNLRCFRVEFDPDFWETAIVGWAKTHTEYRLGEDLPPPDPEMDWECRFCSYKERCGQGETSFQDTGSVGFLPLYVYPRSKVVEYLEAYPVARLTPTLAHSYPELVPAYGSYDWCCLDCQTTVQWDAVKWDGDVQSPPSCPVCLEAGQYQPLRGPAPSDQPVGSQGDSNE